MYEIILKHKEIVNIIASIGTFISAIIAVKTLLEVKKQRLSTYKPELFLKSFVVYIQKSPLFLNPNELILFKIENFNEYNNDEALKKEFNISPLYKIENLGFGIAKNVKVTWTFDIAKALRILKKEFNQDFYLYEYKPLEYTFLKKKNNENFQIAFINKNNIIQTTDYIPPINVKEHTHYHSIPKDITVLHFLYFIFKNKLTERINENYCNSDFTSFPKIKMTVEYYDINNRKYTKKYKFKTSIITTQIEDKIDMTKEFGYLLFELE